MMFKNKVKGSSLLILLLAVIVNCLPSNATNRTPTMTAAGSSDKVNQPLASVTPPAGLIGWWPGDGDARDISGNNNNGTLQNGAGVAIGKVGQTFSDARRSGKDFRHQFAGHLLPDRRGADSLCGNGGRRRAHLPGHVAQASLERARRLIADRATAFDRQ